MVDKQYAKKVPCLSLTIKDFNPNHKYRFFALNVPEYHLMMDLQFVKADDSLYLMPHLTGEYTIHAQNMSGAPLECKVKPGNDLHLSLHETGVINLTVGANKIRLRQAGHERSALGRLFSVAINSVSSLRRVSGSELNPVPTRYKIVSVGGFLDLAPLCLTVYRTPVEEPWVMPQLSDISQMHFEQYFAIRP